MFAHSVVSWTMEQSSSIFSETIAGFPVLDSAIGNGFYYASVGFRQIIHISYAEILYSVTTVKQRAFAFIVFDFQNWDTQLRLWRRNF